MTCSSWTDAVREIISPFDTSVKLFRYIKAHAWVQLGTCSQHWQIIFSKKKPRGTYIWVVKSAALRNVWTKRGWLNWGKDRHTHFRVTWHETNLQCREPQTIRWSASIQSWSVERVAGLAGRGASRPRTASWSRSRVGVEDSLWGQGNAPSACSPPESCPVDTLMQTQLNTKVLNRRTWLSLFFESHVAVNVSRKQ